MATRGVLVSWHQPVVSELNNMMFLLKLFKKKFLKRYSLFQQIYKKTHVDTRPCFLIFFGFEPRRSSKFQFQRQVPNSA